MAGMLGIVLFQHDVAHNYERIKSSLFITLHRPLWAVGLCWIVWASLKGYGGKLGRQDRADILIYIFRVGVVNWILSLSSLQVWSRLTYCAYLIHFQLMLYTIARMRVTIYADDFEGVSLLTKLTQGLCSCQFDRKIVRAKLHLPKTLVLCRRN